MSERRENLIESQTIFQIIHVYTRVRIKKNDPVIRLSFVTNKSEEA